MKLGNLSQTAYRRSVLKQLHTKREDVCSQTVFQENYTGVRLDTGGEMAVSSAISFGNADRTGVYAAVRAILDLEIRGIEAAAVTVQIQLPPEVSETLLCGLVTRMEEVCAQAGVQIASVSVETVPAVRQILVQVTAVGSSGSGAGLQCRNVSPGDDIVLCGYAGLEGMLRILDEQEEQLAERFVPAFIRQMKELRGEILPFSAVREAVSMAREKNEAGISSMYQIAGGGIFAALWNMAEASGTGLDIRMSGISIRQETVEICEYFQLNPYQMTSAGSILMTAANGNELVRRLKEAGARASVLGTATAGKARVVTSGEEIRYLDRPKPDELTVWWDRQK